MKNESVNTVVFPVILYDKDKLNLPIEDLIRNLLPENYKIIKEKEGPDIADHQVPLRQIVKLLNKEAAYASGCFNKQVTSEFVTIDDDSFIHEDLTSFRRIAQDFKERYNRFDLEKAMKDVPVYKSDLPNDMKLHVKDFTDDQISESLRQIKERPRPYLNMPRNDPSHKIKRISDANEYKQHDWYKKYENNISFLRSLIHKTGNLQDQQHDHKQIEMNKTSSKFESEPNWEVIKEKAQELICLIDGQLSENQRPLSKEELNQSIKDLFRIKG